MDKVNARLKTSEFEVESQLKAQIAANYHTDAVELFHKVLHAVDVDDTFTYRGKVFVDLFIAAECALKSILFSLSIESQKTEKIEETYKRIRNNNHDLKKMIEAISNLPMPPNIKLSESCIGNLLDANDLGIDFRYTFDVLLCMNSERESGHFGANDNLIYLTLDNADWIKKLQNSILEVVNLSGDCLRLIGSKHTLRIGEEIEIYAKRHKVFFEQIRKGKKGRERKQ